jgi:hypothetical protein
MSVSGGGPATTMLRWMPARPVGACRPIWVVIMAPQSPPWAPYRWYPRPFMSVSHAVAMRPGSHPRSRVGPENA